MAEANTDKDDLDKAGERFSRNRGRGSGSKNRDAYYKQNDRRNYGFSGSRGSNYRSNRGGSYGGGFRDSNFGRKPYKRVWTNPQGDGKRKRLEVGNRLKEPDIGVTEFIGDHAGFSGFVKERYSDFHVNEISLDGEIAKLTNQIIPNDPEDTETLEDLMERVPSTIRDKLLALKDGLPNTPDSFVELDVTTIDKCGRRDIHKIAKKLANVRSQTVDKNDRQMIIITKNEKSSTNAYRFHVDNRVDWRERGGDYCYFILHKVNIDTMDALNQMAMILRIKPNNFNYAGTKDRRAWTTQWVSLKKVPPNDILRAGKAIRGAFVGNFKYAKTPLKLGMLSGNRFRIAIRNVNASDDEIEKTMISLRDRGFINYYGLQRFGTVAAIPTHEIGKRLLQGKWHEAIELILKPREGEQDRDLAEARKIYESTKDAYAAYNKIKRSDKIEATLLKGLQKCGENNPQGALDMIPRNTRLIYTHAYQSFVWNHMVSRRIRELGSRPVVGDLVYENNSEENAEHLCQDETIAETDEKDKKEDAKESDDATKEDTTATSDPTEKVQEDGDAKESSDLSDPVDDIKEVTSATESSLKIEEKTDESKTENKEEQEDTHSVPAVKILTEEDLPNYTLADIVMPQPGWKITYPPYAKPWFDELLAKDELTTDLRQKNKKYSVRGAYRKILQIPLDLSWKIMHYKAKHDDLISSDINEMRQIPPPEDNPDGEFKALIVEMSLRSSTYATMALREILRQDTSPQAQAAQSAAHDALVESRAESKTVADKSETNNSGNEDIESTEVEKKSEESDKVEEKMDVDLIPENPAENEKQLVESEKEMEVEAAAEETETNETKESTETEVNAS